MNHNLRLRSFTALTLVLTWAALAFTPASRVAVAQEPADAAASTPPRELLLSLLERSSLLLVDIDISKIDLPALVQWGMQVGGVDEGAAPPQQAVQMATSVIDSLRRAGSSHVYLSVATRSPIDRGPVIIIPTDDVQAVEGIAAMLLQGGGAGLGLQVRTRPGLVLIGPATVLDRLTAEEGKPPGEAREDLVDPLDDPARLDHVAVISLVDEYQQELAAIWPDALPAAAPLQLSPRQLIVDIERVVVGLRLPPEPVVQVDFVATDDQAAARVEQTLQMLRTALADQLTHRPQADTDAEAEPDLNSVEIRRDGSRVKIVLSEALLGQLKGITAMGIVDPQQQSNDLKQIGLAMHNYHATYQHFPPKYFVDRQGHPLTSWRVAILPYIEQQALYQSLKLDQPWNAAANAKFSALAILTYADEGGDDPTKTRFRVPVFPGSAWDGDGPPKTFAEFTDGTSNTIAVIHAPADAAVHWADPAEWRISPENPMQDIFGDRDEVTVLLFDGAVVKLQRDEMDNEKLSALLTIAGGEPSPW